MPTMMKVVDMIFGVSASKLARLTCRKIFQLKLLAGDVISDELGATEVKASLVLSVGLPESTVNPYSPAVDGIHRKLPFADVLTTSTQPVLPNVPASSTVGDAGPTHSRINERLDSRREHHEGPHVRLSDTGTGSMSSLPALRSSGRTPYVTDPSNINYLIREFGYPGQNATDVLPIEEYLRRAMLEWLGSPTIEHVEGLRSSTIGRLKNEGAFDLPSGDISAALLNAFFQHPFPSLSVIERSDFMKSIETGTVPHLLLNAIYMVATIYCPDSVIDEAGFATRYVASLTFYNRAKDIYDTGYETDAVVVIQATFLLSHWWSDPLEQKDPWYWLGITAGMAQLLVRPLPNLFKFRVCNVSKHYFTYLPTHHSNSQYQLLFHRKCPDAAQNMGPGSPIFEICTRLFRMLEDLATSGNLFSVAGHALPAVMASVCFHIVNTSKGDTQVKSISEHRARFCLLILKDLRASWPIIASVYPFFTSMFRRYSGVSFSDCEKDELCCSQPTQQTGDPAIISEDVVRAPEGDTSLYGRFLHDENSAVLNSTFPFTYLFEDVFLTPSLIDTTL
ncbi:Dihydrofolate reductase [Penicillium atrosanguineum]|uniref:Dihydrofolate reductase n=1 Tax=Penicillium atrosanguineum TaxID=1132637 RepID=UPI0023861CF7|nr:Dihydrofolate reductase [Penicillium atrosanguineum]KAJ5289720.1 Dihydrofolate reductase [Penicillium atrosanguineum]